MNLYEMRGISQTELYEYNEVITIDIVNSMSGIGVNVVNAFLVDGEYSCRYIVYEIKNEEPDLVKVASELLTSKIEKHGLETNIKVYSSSEWKFELEKLLLSGSEVVIFTLAGEPVCAESAIRWEKHNSPPESMNSMNLFGEDRPAALDFDEDEMDIERYLFKAGQMKNSAKALEVLEQTVSSFVLLVNSCYMYARALKISNEGAEDKRLGELVKSVQGLDHLTNQSSGIPDDRNNDKLNTILEELENLVKNRNCYKKSWQLRLG